MQAGSIVRCRNREWVLLPSDNDAVWALRPLTGGDEDIVLIHRELSAHLSRGGDGLLPLPTEQPEPARFPPPRADDVADATSARLLWQAARLTLREGATPFRSLARISIRPRVYQFVPLLMALRLDPVRLFIADDVGVGKTIEALLIARELIDRGEIRRLCVLCPPYLCEQWAAELADKFNLQPVILRSGTIAQLERQVPHGKSVYEYFPVQIASIDFVKTERNRHHFLQFCPEFVIVDEAHGAAEADERTHQERHALLRRIASDATRHLILLSATPHSGVEAAFRSLLALLQPEFGTWNLAALDDQQRTTLARHFVQRTRADIQQQWESASCFPKRITSDETYDLSPAARTLFERTYAFCSEIVRTGEQLEERKRRVRYWGALALLRCVMSSPAAALAALRNRAQLALADTAEEDTDYRPFVFEADEDRTDDDSPTPPLEAAEDTLAASERRKLRELERLAEALRGPAHDAKLARAIAMTRTLLRDGYAPILWCRYVATAEYLAEHLRPALEEEVQVVCITGRLGDEERKAKIDEIDPQAPRVLVATDCLSEGVNLQEKFTAVVHYDLPWNPNRLEQREGRVDRYGQPAPEVKAVRYFGRDNPVDGVVIEVLLDKATEIHRTLGTHVPVPEESESVTQAVLEALFLRGNRAGGRQLVLDLGIPAVAELHRRWERDAERERINRTRFAQRALKPEEVHRELEATDAVLGDPAEVRDFVLSALQRLGVPIGKDPAQSGVYRVSLAPESLATLPEGIRLALSHHTPRAARRATQAWRVSFDSPTPEGAEYLGRNHPFVQSLARLLFEQALAGDPESPAKRCGLVCTSAVTWETTLWLLRVRYLLEQPGLAPLLAEEVRVIGMHKEASGKAAWLDDHECRTLLTRAQAEQNVSLAEKRERLAHALAQWPDSDTTSGNALRDLVAQAIKRRAAELAEAHKRIRRAASLRVRGLTIQPQFPPDVLGVLVLQPKVPS